MRATKPPWLVLAMLTAVFFAPPTRDALAQDAFFKGRTVTIVVGSKLE